MRSRWALVGWTWVANVLDAFATLFWVSHGVTEANPFMASLLAWSVAAFLVYKIVIVLGFLVVVSFSHNGRILKLLCGVYSLLLLWHAYGGLQIGR